jgi:hypothetical protein
MRGPFGSLTALLSKTYLKKRFPHRFLPSSGALTLIAFRVPVATSSSSKFEHRRKFLLDSSLAAPATIAWACRESIVQRNLLSDWIVRLSVRIMEQAALGTVFCPEL